MDFGNVTFVLHVAFDLQSTNAKTILEDCVSFLSGPDKEKWSLNMGQKEDMFGDESTMWKLRAL